nr:MAG TPA: hypothetical protein [Bacteriophage sp.]
MIFRILFFKFFYSQRKIFNFFLQIYFFFFF